MDVHTWYESISIRTKKAFMTLQTMVGSPWNKKEIMVKSMALRYAVGWLILGFEISISM